MMMNLLRKLSVFFLLIVCHNLFSCPNTGLLFNVTATGTPAQISLALCLNGRGPLSCQRYTVSALSLNISTSVPKQTYPDAGIKVLTPGYRIENCTAPTKKGYCLFAVSDTAGATITLGLSALILSNPSSIPEARVNTYYSTTINVAGGSEPYTYTLISGALPPGLLLNKNNGEISGTALQDGSFSFRIKATDSSSPPKEGSQSYTIVVHGPLSLSPETLLPAQQGLPYNQKVDAEGGTAPYTFTLSAGTLPPDLTLSDSGLISGIPMSTGSFNITITATDAEGHTGSQTYTLVVSGPLPLSPQFLLPAQKGVQYNQSVTANLGTAPYTYALSGTLPPGLTFNTNSGLISGVPTTPGVYNFTVTVTDAHNLTGTQEFSILVSGPLALSPQSLLPVPAELNEFYSQPIVSTLGMPVVTYAVISGQVPPGTSLNTASGVLSGQPDVAGTYTFTVQATDSQGNTGATTFTLVVSGPGLILPASLISAPAQLNMSYNAALASDGTPPVTYAITYGKLPPELSLNTSSGVISGMAKVAGTYLFTVTTTDANNVKVSKSYTLVVTGPLTLSPPASLPVGSRGIAYNASITASGGTAPITYAVTAGSLPPGLSLDMHSGLISGTPSVTGTYAFTVTATDATGTTGSQYYTIVINPWAYIVNSGADTVSICTVNADGSLSGCVPFNPGTLSDPLGMTINTANTMAYIANFGNNTISICRINPNGSFGTCTPFSDPSFQTPEYIVLNTKNTLAYITNPGNNIISICQIKPNGFVSPCSAYRNAFFDKPRGITLNTANTRAYITSSENHSVSICSIDLNGFFLTCSKFDDTTLNYPRNITLNATNSLAYIANGGNNSISICPVESNGNLNTCTESTFNETFNGPVDIVFNTPNTLAYITNHQGTTVSICPVKSDGFLDICTASSAIFSAPYGIVITPY